MARKRHPLFLYEFPVATVGFIASRPTRRLNSATSAFSMKEARTFQLKLNPPFFISAMASCLVQSQTTIRYIAHIRPVRSAPYWQWTKAGRLLVSVAASEIGRLHPGRHVTAPCRNEGALIRCHSALAGPNAAPAG